VSGTTIFDRLGRETFFALSRHFYERALDDPLVGPMLPRDDIEGAIARQALFLIQFFGGPAEYSERRGHPRLRARHMPFPITSAARDNWVAHMEKALEETGIGGEERQAMLEYFERAATFMINSQSTPE
jgi:hemoglobin